MGFCRSLDISCISLNSSKNGDDDDSDKDNDNDNRLLDLHVVLTNNCTEMVLLSNRTWCNNIIRDGDCSIIHCVMINEFSYI